MTKKKDKEYKYSFEHYCDGFQEYDRELFIAESHEIKKTLKAMKKENIVPRVGECVFGEDTCYYVKQVVFYECGLVVWLDEDELRVNPR